MPKMDIVEFQVHEDFTPRLLEKFNAFCATLRQPCAVVFDIESQGGHTEVIKAMEATISGLKKKGFLIITNVDECAYSAGLFLFLLGDIKTCSDTARFMFHSSGFTVADRLVLDDVEQMAEVLRDHDVFVRRIMEENTRIADGMFEILRKNDNFLSRKDLIYLGLMQEEYEPIL
jgi:ATP-dependent protease ClpP protease subunit